MNLELASIPLAAAAGVLGVLSPCVWPLVPVVMSTAMGEGGWRGAVFVSLGLAFAFAVAGTLLSFVLVQTGLDPELFRFAAGGVLLLVAAMLLSDALAARASVLGSRWTGRLQTGGGKASTAWGGFSVGTLLGFVWLPCVGPTLGAAIGLASLGQDFLLAFLTMAAYGLGTGGVLLAAGLLSRQLIARWRPRLSSSVGWAKKGLGATLGILAVLVLTGLDKRLEAWGVGWLPDWSSSL